MENVWVLASLWVWLALVATLLAIWLKISTALSEIVVGTVAQLVIGAFLIQGGLGAKTSCAAPVEKVFGKNRSATPQPGGVPETPVRRDR